jgi:hypothetical protein
MSPNQIRQALKTPRFKPFSICLSDGSALHVAHPDFVFVPPAPNDWEIVVYDTANQGFDIIDLATVTRLDFKNGGKHAKR